MSLERSLTAIAIAALSLVVAGCPKVRVGATCDLGVGDAGLADADPTAATINPGVPTCPGRICVQPTAEKSTTTGPLCSADCSSDDDCNNNEITRSATDPHCKSGFSCVVVTTVGPLCCQKLCICRDFFSESQTPPECVPGMSACPNVH